MFCCRPSENRIKRNIEKGNLVTLPQLRHLISLVAEGKQPDATYSTEECTVYEMIRIFHDNPQRFTDRSHR